MGTQLALSTLVLVLLVLSDAFAEGRSTSFSYLYEVDLAALETDGGLLRSGDAIFNIDTGTYDLNYAAYEQTQFCSCRAWNDPFYLPLLAEQECGRMLYPEKVRMVDEASGRVASFNTSFTFSISHYGFNGTDYCGYGMAFSFAATHDPYWFNHVARGSGMCAFDYSDRAIGAYLRPVFAVKFDSHLDDDPSLTGRYPDPSDSNIGVVVIDKQGNSTVKHHNLCNNVNNNLTHCNVFCSTPDGLLPGFFTAWIDYDSATQNLQVRFRNGSMFDYDETRNVTRSRKPADAVISVSNLRLNEVLTAEDMYVGFSASTGPGMPSNVRSLVAWEFSSSEMPDHVSSSSAQGSPESSPVQSPAPGYSPGPPPAATSHLIVRPGLVAGITSGAAVLAAVVTGFFFFFCFNRRSQMSSVKLEQASNLILTDTPRVFTFNELSRMTKNFSDSELLAGGAFGDVFHGTLPASRGSLVAVKPVKANNEDNRADQSAKAKRSEHIRQLNLLQLRGWCQGKEGLLLVYD